MADVTAIYVARNLMSIEICAPARLLGQEMLVRFEADGPEGEPRRCQRLTKELWADIWSQVLRMELDYWVGKLSQDKAQIVADRIKPIREFFQGEFT